MNKGGYLSEDSIKTYNEFQRQAGKIHDMHIEQEISADVEIAEKRIKKYFNGELNLSWKSIIYEINKLPELQRNKYFKNLVDEQVKKQILEIDKAYNEQIKKERKFTYELHRIEKILTMLRERRDTLGEISTWTIWTFIKQRKAIKKQYIRSINTIIENYERKKNDKLK